MSGKIRKLVKARNLVEDIESVLSCIGVAVTARPLQSNEMDGALVILQWSGQKLYDCSQELGVVIDQLGSVPN